MDQIPLGETKRRILVLLLEGETTAEALATKMKMNLSVIRRHLEDMVAQGLVKPSFKKTGRGRPSKMYTITLDGRTNVSSKYDLVAELLTMAAFNDLSEGKTRELYASAGRILAGGAGRHESLASLLPVLADFGFQPELRREGTKEYCVSKNCPILKIAQKYPTMTCDTFHTVFLREALGKPNVMLIQAIARGATECKHEL
ncbi:MAG TPA: ArsR family transcriptional regulator [Nitrososphaerales archaeon]|nr:ArsR family transcriptional regulator [Nitrososphaerales archaeon]